MVVRDLERAIQPAAQVVWSSIQWTVQGIDGGWERHPNVSKLRPAAFIFGSFTGKFPTGRVKNAIVSGSVIAEIGGAGFPVNERL